MIPTKQSSCALGGTDLLMNFENAGDIYFIEYKDGKTRACGFTSRHSSSPTPTHSAGCSVGFHRKSFSGSAPMRFTPKLIPVRSKRCSLRTTPVEQWRHKMPGYEWHSKDANWKIEHAGELDTRPSEVAAPHRSPPIWGLPLQDSCILLVRVVAVR